MTPLWQRRPVGIVGLGLIGGSLGLDLLALGAEVRALVHRQATADRALERGLVSAVSTDPEVLRDCGLVLLALPLDRLLDPPPSLLGSLLEGAVITDVGSVKGPVLAAWERLLGPTGFSRFVGSHPMAGTARSGVEAGERDLFRGRPWVVTPAACTDPAAMAEVRQLAEALGSRWIRCSASDHDRAVALISHLPVLVSAALLQAADRGAAADSTAPGALQAAGGLPNGGGLPDGGGTGDLGELVRALASSGFADTSRVGGGNPELGTWMARWNREALLAALDHYRQALDGLETAVRRQDWPGLLQELSDCQQLRPAFLQAPLPQIHP
jgi:arogenate dehydrogenase (NADP+)